MDGSRGWGAFVVPHPPSRGSTMPKLILPQSDLKRLIRERRRTGADRLDEVWDGVYVMSPDPDNEHQHVAGKIVSALDQAFAHLPGIRVYPSINVSDRRDD